MIHKTKHYNFIHCQIIIQNLILEKLVNIII